MEEEEEEGGTYGEADEEPVEGLPEAGHEQHQGGRDVPWGQVTMRQLTGAAAAGPFTISKVILFV